MRLRIKICCIRDIEEAKKAVAVGADALGLVSAMPSGPGVISETKIAEVAAWAPASLDTFLLTSSQDPHRIARQVRSCRPTTVQLCDAMTADACAAIRRAVPEVALVQVIHVIDEASIEEALQAASFVDALLLDSGNPSLAVKELGGTGRTHDWWLSRRIVASSNVPVYLAGGLTADNVADAVGQVRPFGVDICSGVRTDGQLDTVKLARFVAAVRRAEHATWPT